MENKIKTIASLKKDLAEIEVELQNSYKNLGNKLFIDAGNPTMDKTVIKSEDLMAWQKLRDERDLSSESILNIKKNSERLSELQNFEKELSSSNKTNTKKIERIKPQFLTALYKDFAPNCSSIFAPILDDLHKIEAEIDEIKQKNSQIENEKKDANFFTKLSYAPKITSNKRKIAKLENRITELLSKNVSNIQDNTEIKNLYNFEAFNDEMRKQFEELTTLYSSMDDSQKRLDMLNEEREFVTKGLSELGVDKNSNKKLNALNNDIKKIDSDIEEILLNTAIKFADEFYDEAGQSLTGKDFTENELKDYTEFLRRISFYRQKSSKVRYNMQYCEIQDKIQHEKTKLANAERNIKNAEKAIEEAKTKIKEAELSKQNSEDELVSLNLEADKLKEKFATNADLEIANESEVSEAPESPEAPKEEKPEDNTESNAEDKA